MQSILKKTIGGFWQTMLEYVLPAECLGCGQEGRGEFLCSACFDRIIYFEKWPCFLCNAGEYSTGICPSCAAAAGIDAIFVATRYEGSIAGRIVEQYKYNFLEAAGEILVRILAKQICRQGLAAQFSQSVLIPIPLHRRRLAERGYNQAAAIARGLAGQFNCQMEENLLKRVRYTGQQAKLARAARQENMRDAFDLNPATPVPRNVLLVDDVLTTGATFIEATHALKQGGVEKVVCLAVCHG